jgi:hypothetical protein
MAMTTICTALLFAALFSIAAEAQAPRSIQVGGSDCGWALGCFDFQTWFSRQNVRVGDVLVFKYSGSHNVVQYNTAAAYTACSAVPTSYRLLGNLTAGRGLTGVRVTVTATPMYLGCSVGNGFHCTNGMKFVARPNVARRAFNFFWGNAGPVTYQTKINALGKLRAGDAVVLTYSCCHPIIQYKTLADYRICNTNPATYTLVANAQAKVVSLPVRSAPQYIACQIPDHCKGDAMKFIIPAATLV